MSGSNAIQLNVAAHTYGHESRIGGRSWQYLLNWMRNYFDTYAGKHDTDSEYTMMAAEICDMVERMSALGYEIIDFGNHDPGKSGRVLMRALPEHIDSPFLIIDDPDYNVNIAISLSDIVDTCRQSVKGDAK